jgi:hypothetical protein|tara:strand:+ start:76 stop:351 length:276 start_codon:yes stop_codon:yes gene_type:complete
MKKFFTKLNITQKIFLFLFFLNQPLYYFYGKLWLDQSKTRIGSGGRRSNEIKGEVYENYNQFKDEEIFLWIGVSIILLIGFFLFKSNQENE